MRGCSVKLAKDTSLSSKFKVANGVQSVVLGPKQESSTLTMTIGRWSFGVFFASTVTRSSDRAGTLLR